MRKKRILFCSEATFLQTGYATYTREILNYLHKTGKYEIAELAAYGSEDDQRSFHIPWHYYPAALPRSAREEDRQKFASKISNQFGEFYFHETCLDFKPDVVCDIRDFWMMEFVQRSPFRQFFKWCIMPTVDASPQAHQWIDTYSSADACLSYSDWSGKVLLDQSGGKINYLGSAPPSAHPAYSSILNREQSRKDLMISDQSINIVGTVMRNQRRKLYPDLFQAFRNILDSVDNPQKYMLYCHTSYPDMGWDIPSLLQSYGLASNVLFTYICSKTNKPFASCFRGPRTVSPFAKKAMAYLPNVQKGLEYYDLAKIMNAFDLYVQYANSEGFGLPQVEAAACGTPVASINYSAMESVVEQLEAIPLTVKALYKEMETGCMRAVPDNQENATIIKEYLDKPFFEKDRESFKIKQNFLKHFQWDKSGKVWEQYFDGIEIANEKETWLSSPDIQSPHGMVPESNFKSNVEKVDFLFQHVLHMPDKINNSYLYDRMTRDLDYGFSTAANGGIYHNDSSMVLDGGKRATVFNYEKAYQECLNIRYGINEIEQQRAEWMARVK